MNFTDAGFICIFFPAFLFAYLFTGTEWRKYVLVVASLIFVGVGSITGLFQMLSLLAVNYVLLRLQKGKRDSHGLLILWISALVDVAFLFLSRLSGIAVFAGISFMVFRLISLQADRYRLIVKKCPSVVDYLCFASLFATMNAGPVTRFDNMKGAIDHPKVSFRGIDRGLRLFTVGLSMKTFLADRISYLWTEILSPGAATLSVPAAWLGAFAASSEIYYDFFGYSLMAMGIGIMIGIPVPANFDEPYSSNSISDFYRRWHITLGQWFRDYVYIPLGGSRRGIVRTVINVMVVWFLTGLWHGFSPNYILWGCMLGVLVSLEKMPFYKKLRKKKYVSVILHVVVFMIIAVSWCVFKNENTGDMLSYLSSLVGLNRGEQVLTTGQQLLRYLKDYWFVLIPCVLFMTPFPGKLWKKYSDTPAVAVLLVPLFWLSLHESVIGKTGSFIYMRY